MQKPSFKIIGNKINFENGDVIVLEYQVLSHLLAEDTLVVVLRVPNGVDMLNNVLGINVRDSKIIWKVEKYPYQDKPFNSVVFTKTNKVGLRGSRDVIINANTGKILELLRGYK